MKTLWIGMILCLAAAVGFAADSRPKRTLAPDVFLVTIDTLRADHVHCYGYDQVQTPALDGLAKDGVRFSQAFTPSPLTNTSHTTILTGLLPSSHGVTDFAVPLAATHPTWAELLEENGYHTAAFIGAVILDSNSLAPGLNRGFDFYDNFPEHPHGKSRWGRVERRGMDVVRRAETWLNANPSRPHFVWVHLYDPHDPYEPPPPYSQIYHTHLYDGEIAYADSALANFIRYLKMRGWYENAVIIAVGDHGEGLGEHQENTHGIFLYDSTTHVPLIIKLPGSRYAGRVVNAQVRTTDILPTVLDLLNLPLPERLDGKSLRPYFDDAEISGRVAFGETDYPLHFGWAPLRSVRADGFKLIEAPRPELYNVRNDPGELKNIYQQRDETVRTLRSMLQKSPVRTASTVAFIGAPGSQAVGNLAVLGDLAAAGSTGSAAASNRSLLPDPKDRIEQQNLLHSAMLAIEDDRSLEAMRDLEQVLHLDPRSRIALRQIGELELHAGDYARAATHLDTLRQILPADPSVALEDGQALEKTGDLPHARDALAAGLKMNPGQFPAELLLGNVYLRLNNAQAAEDQFEAALLLEPKNVEAQLGLAKAEIGEGNLHEAATQLEMLSKAHRGNAEAFRLLSQVYKGMGKAEEAEQAQKNADRLEHNPHRRSPYDN